MAELTINNFAGGLNTRMASHLIGINEAITCLNADLTNGAIAPALGLFQLVSQPSIAGTVSICKWNSTWYGSASLTNYSFDEFFLYEMSGSTPYRTNKAGVKRRIGIFPDEDSVGTQTPKATASGSDEVVAEELFDWIATFYGDPASGGNGVESAPTNNLKLYNGYTPESSYVDIGFVGTLKGNLTADATATTLQFTRGYATSITGSVTVKLGTEYISGTMAQDSGTPGGLYSYTLSAIHRGQYGSVPAAHYSGDIVLRAMTSINLAVSASPNPLATHIRLYRLKDGDYRLAATVANTPSTTFGTPNFINIQDTASDEDLMDAETLSPTIDNYPPFVNGTKIQGVLVSGTKYAIVNNTEIFKPGMKVCLEHRYVYNSGTYGAYRENLTVDYINAANNRVYFLEALVVNTSDINFSLNIYPTWMIQFNGMSFYGQCSDLGWTQIGEASYSNPLWRLTFPSDVQFVVPHAGMLIVGTLDGIHTIAGDNPDSISRFKVPGSIGCKSGAGLTAVSTENGVLYLSNDGVTLFNGNACAVISRGKLARSTFTGLSALYAAYHDQQYHLMHSSGEIIGDFRDGLPRWTQGDQVGLSAFHSEIDDALYIGKADGKIYQYGTGSVQGYTYQTGDLSIGDQDTDKAISMMMVDCDGEATAQIYCDGTLRHTQNIVNATRAAKHYKTSADCRGQRIQLKLTGITANGDPATVYGVGLDVVSGKSRQ